MRSIILKSHQESKSEEKEEQLELINKFAGPHSRLKGNKRTLECSSLKPNIGCKQDRSAGGKRRVGFENRGGGEESMEVKKKR